MPRKLTLSDIKKLNLQIKTSFKFKGMEHVFSDIINHLTGLLTRPTSSQNYKGRKGAPMSFSMRLVP